MATLALGLDTDRVRQVIRFDGGGLDRLRTSSVGVD